MKIYCPQCGWEPTSNARWLCRPGCDFVWNTFDTHGQCPNCFKQWKETKCLQCHEWSRHEDWYHEGEPAINEKREETLTAR